VPENESPWVVKGVPEDVRRKVRVYAARHTISMADAVAFLIDAALEDQDCRRMRWERGTAYLRAVGVMRPNDSQIVDVLWKASEINGLLAEGRPYDEYGLDINLLRQCGLLIPISQDY
jgi:plasmid stability protein